MTIPQELNNIYNYPTSLSLYTLEYTDFEQANCCYDCYTIINDFFGIGYYNHDEQPINFYMACQNGLITPLDHYNNAPYIILLELFEKNNYFIFKTVCKKGYLNVLKWLNKYFSNDVMKEALVAQSDDDYYQPDDLVDIYYNGFQLACKYGHLNILNWMFTTFPNNMNNLFYEDECTCFLLATNNINTLKWLNDKFSDNNAMNDAFYDNGIGELHTPSDLDWIKNCFSPDRVNDVFIDKVINIFTHTAYYEKNIPHNIVKIKWCYANLPNVLPHCMNWIDNIYTRTLLKTKQFHIIKFLYNKFPIKVTESFNRHRIEICGILKNYKTPNEIQQLDWIFKTFEYSDTTIFFYNACKDNNSTLLSWIIANTSPTDMKSAFKHSHNKAFNKACLLNNTTITKILLTNFPSLTKSAFKRDNYAIFDTVCDKKHIQILNQFAKYFSHKTLTKAFKQNNYRTYKLCCKKRKHTNVLIWLDKQFPKKVLNAFKQDNCNAFHTACTHRNIKVLNHFITTHPIETHNAYTIHHTGYKPMIQRWFSENF